MSARLPWQKIRANVLCCSLILLVGILIYGNHLKHPFQFDSVHYILDKQELQHPEDLTSFDFFKKEYRSRSLLTMTIAWNAMLGQLNPYGYHLFNLTFHLLNSVLLFFIAGKTCRHLQLHRMGITGKDARVLSLFAALLFLSHPLQTESTIDIMGRSEVLSATFYLGAFFLLQTGLNGRVAPVFRYIVVPVAILAVTVLGFGVKQTLITLPSMLLLYYLCGCAPESLPLRILKRGKWFFLLVAGVGFALLLRKLLSDEAFLVGPAPVEQMVGRKIYMLSQPSVLVFYYLKLLFFPVNLNVDPDIFLVNHVFSPRFISAMLLMILAVYLAAAAKRSRIWFFFVAWFFIIVSPSSSIITLQDLAAEHRVYLASYGFCLLLVLGLLRLTAPVEGRADAANLGNARLIGCVTLTVITLLLCGMTVKRSAVWKSEQTLWDDARKKSPAKARPLTNLARSYTFAGNASLAIIFYEQSIAINPRLFESHYNLGDLYYKSGRVDEALNHIRTAAMLEPSVAEIQGRLGEIYMDLKQYELAEGYLKKAVELNPRYVTALRNLAVVNYYYLKDRKREGLVYFARVLELDPNQTDAYLIRRLLGQP